MEQAGPLGHSRPLPTIARLFIDNYKPLSKIFSFCILPYMLQYTKREIFFQWLVVAIKSRAIVGNERTIGLLRSGIPPWTFRFTNTVGDARSFLSAYDAFCIGI